MVMIPVRAAFSIIVSAVAAVGGEAMARPGGDELPFVFSGTLVVQGQGIAQVQAIGAQTEMGKIGNALQTVKSEVTPLQQEMNRLVNRLFGIALSLCVAIVVIYGLTRGDWLKGLLAGITLAMVAGILSAFGTVTSGGSYDRFKAISSRGHRHQGYPESEGAA